MRLNLGAGLQQIPGYTTVDRHTEADISADLWNLPLPPDCAEEIYSSHALEHLSFEEAPRALVEWHRVLTTGGKLTIVVPNLDFVCAVWLNGGDRSYARQIIFGNQQHEGEFHKNGWDEKGLRADVEAAGFTIVGCSIRYTPEYSQESIILEATKA